VSKEDGEKWRDEPIPPPEKRPTIQWPLIIGDGTGGDISEGFNPQFTVDGDAQFNFAVRFLGDARVYGALRVDGELLAAGDIRLADTYDQGLKLLLSAAYLQFYREATTPADSTLSDFAYRSAKACNVYLKSEKFIIQVNQSATATPDVHYFYLDLLGTSGTWTHATSAP
jgi:hypothetical protein